MSQSDYLVAAGIIALKEAADINLLNEITYGARKDATKEEAENLKYKSFNNTSYKQ